MNLQCRAFLYSSVRFCLTATLGSASLLSIPWVQFWMAEVILKRREGELDETARRGDDPQEARAAGDGVVSEHP